jgi:hypothetical protein
MARHPSDTLLRLARNAEEPRRDSDNANVEYCPALGTLDNLDYIRIPIMLGTENHLPAERIIWIADSILLDSCCFHAIPQNILTRWVMLNTLGERRRIALGGRVLFIWKVTARLDYRRFAERFFNGGRPPSCPLAREASALALDR